jgi:hypothetical protein
MSAQVSESWTQSRELLPWLTLAAAYEENVEEVVVYRDFWGHKEVVRLNYLREKEIDQGWVLIVGPQERPKYRGCVLPLVVVY